MKRGFMLFAFLLALAGCANRGPMMMDVGNAIKREYTQRLATEPDFAMIRGKPGICIEDCPLRVHASDNRYPTEAELAAIAKFERLMWSYYNKFMKESRLHARSAREHAFLQREQSQMDSHLQAVFALHDGKLTWMQYGQLCAQIFSDRMAAEDLAEAWAAQEAREREAQEAAREAEEREAAREAEEQEARERKAREKARGKAREKARKAREEAREKAQKAREEAREKARKAREEAQLSKQKKSESKKQESEDKGHKPEGKGQKPEDKGQKTRRQRIEAKGQNPETRKQRIHAARSPKEGGESLTPNAGTP
jgi:hypothetical protein